VYVRVCVCVFLCVFSFDFCKIGCRVPVPVDAFITPALIQLHWLPVKQQAVYKLALITFNVLQHNNPMYLRDLLTTHNPSRNLRSSSQHLLSVSYMRTASLSHCFKHSVAINWNDWNDLPFDIRACDSVNVFKRKKPSHVSSPRLRITFQLHMAHYKFYIVLYCIVSLR